MFDNIDGDGLKNKKSNGLNLGYQMRISTD